MFKVLLCLFVFGVVQAQTPPDEDNFKLEVGVDFAQQDPYMSDKYRKGSYLLYDCDSGHWVCAGRAEYERCVRWRKEGLELKDDWLSCAYFVSFGSRKECQKEQIEMTNMAPGERFCLHPAAKGARLID